MRAAIVFNHPYEKSFCNAILNAVTKGLQNGQHEVDLIHLDNDGFNPVMSKADLKAFAAHKPVDPQVKIIISVWKKQTISFLFSRFGGI
jgi:NAD(P)H dehydrogenase (quinone)